MDGKRGLLAFRQPERTQSFPGSPGSAPFEQDFETGGKDVDVVAAEVACSLGLE